jgi:hypothetical protein
MASLVKAALAQGSPLLASTAKKTPAWKLPAKIPTMPVDISSARLTYNTKGALVQRIEPATKAFVVNVQPIGPLKTPPAPLAKGSNMLRAFLWAREHFPQSNLIEVKEKAVEAVYESHRVDGLPRVIFALAKEVRNPLNIKIQIGGILRHRFKRRARRAFRDAIEELRRKDPSITSPVILILLALSGCFLFVL